MALVFLEVGGMRVTAKSVSGEEHARDQHLKLQVATMTLVREEKASRLSK